MREALPVLLGFCFGAIVMRRHLHAAFAVGITGCIALAAVSISGEFRESWTYTIVDLLEAALGFVAGSVVAWRYRISAVQK